MGGEEDDRQAPLLSSSSSPDDHQEEPRKRTGTEWTAIAHVITGVIGAGVLSLAWSVAQLGWIAGPLLMIAFAGITVVSTNLLCDCYRYPDPEHGPSRIRSYMEAVKLYLGDKNQKVCGVIVNESLYGTGIAYIITSASSIRSPDSITGTRNYSYMDAVRVNLGKKHTWFCGFLQYFSLYGTGIVYVITTATSMRAIQRSNCYHREGHQAACTYGDTFYMLLFGLIQIVMSQIPDFHNMEWLSIVAALMSFTYSFIGFGLGVAKVIENGTIMGSISGVPTTNIADKLWLAFQALGDIAFAYPYSIIVLEIQDTLRSPPAENRTMKKASMAAIFITTFFYLCCGCFGYAAFGNATPGNLLTGFGFYEPYWLIDLANACIVLHLVGGYQIYSQPVFAFAERWFTKKFPNSGFVNNFYTFKLPLLPGFKWNLLRLCFRTAYVISTTIIAMLFPYFNQVLGLLGALNFWPLTIYFPVEMYFVQKKIGAWTKKWIVLRTFSLVCFLVTVLGLIGSLEGLISAKLS